MGRRPRYNSLRCITLAVLIPSGTLGSVDWAHAQGLMLTWGSCGEPRLGNRAFACNTDAGSDVLSVAFRPYFPLSQVARAEVYMELCTPQLTLPAWWQFLGAGACRAGSLAMASTAPVGSCTSLWDPAARLTTSIYLQAVGAYGMKFDPSVTLVDTALAQDMVLGQDYELFRLVIDHAHAIGPGACAGCDAPAIISTDFIWLWTATGQGLGGASYTSATWQSSAVSCYTIVPTRRSTWGSLKSLYR